MQRSSRLGAAYNVAFNAAGGASTQSPAFGTQTYQIRVAVVGILAVGSGVRIAIAENPTASATSTLLPVNIPEYITVTPGQKIAVLSNDITTGNLSVTEIT